MNALFAFSVTLLGSILVGCSKGDRLDGMTAPSPHRFSEALACFDPGGHVMRTDTPVEGTLQYADHEESGLYQTARCDTDGYTFRLPNGKYYVALSFAELEYDVRGKRVFGVMLQGHRVKDRLDIFALVGKYKAYRFRSPDVDVTDGLLRIRFERIVGAPCVAGISIGGNLEGAKSKTDRVFLQHINCGGASFGGYYADYGM